MVAVRLCECGRPLCPCGAHAVKVPAGASVIGELFVCEDECGWSGLGGRDPDEVRAQYEALT